MNFLNGLRVAKVKYLSEEDLGFFPINEPIYYTLSPGCSDEEGALVPLSERFTHHNEFRISIGKPAISYDKYHEWFKS